MAILTLRISDEYLDDFRKRCEQLNRKPNDTLRELIQAFAEDRIMIQPTTEQIQERKLYNES